jgi:hypothetical protein
MQWQNAPHGIPRSEHGGENELGQLGRRADLRALELVDLQTRGLVEQIEGVSLGHEEDRRLQEDASLHQQADGAD